MGKKGVHYSWGRGVAISSAFVVQQPLVFPTEQPRAPDQSGKKTSVKNFFALLALPTKKKRSHHFNSRQNKKRNLSSVHRGSGFQSYHLDRMRPDPQRRQKLRQ
ncbi:hypothetical protein CEXT_668331 [Caerostris extrusa]|uniref:Uncharacterized protein n=1 Tax=Caerostris extrusa TaxID=172846 RepID=A0AAV4UB86_CAEEX|nr:hypothetical protein CEXT_668331 [Caerostris extrusa]